MMFTHDIDEWLQEVDLWSRRETEDLLAALEQERSVGMFEFATSDSQRCYVMTPHVNSVLVLQADRARCGLVERLQRSLRGEWDSCLMPFLPSPSATTAPNGAKSRLM